MPAPWRKVAELARLPEVEFTEQFRRSPVKRAKWRGLMRNVAALSWSGRLGVTAAVDQ